MDPTQSHAPFDELTAGLRALRAAAGEPSYAELTRRVIEQRVARGSSPWEARVGRTTVYDAFRPGRRMIDPALIGDLVRALGGSEQDAAAWAIRAEAARRYAPPVSVDAPVSDEVPVSVDAPVFDKVPVSVEAPPPVEAASPVKAPPPVKPPPHAEAPPTPAVRTLPRGRVLLFACLLINLAGRVVVLQTHIPLYLDMIGTAIAALVVGPWAGALVGAATSLSGAAIDGWISVPFLPVEVVGALVWGYGVRGLGWGRTLPRFFVLNVVVALCCTIVAVPIIVWVDHGVTGDGADAMTHSMMLVWHSLLPAVASQNTLTSIADKLISGYVALTVSEALAMHAAGDERRLRLHSRWAACVSRLPALTGR